jgi:uncharacterized protein with PQ loop repeat
MPRRPLAHIELHTHLIDKIAVANGVLSGIALWPQVATSIFSPTSDGLSWLTFGIILVNSVVWSLYAIHRRLVALLLASLLNTLAATILLLLALS